MVKKYHEEKPVKALGSIGHRNKNHQSYLPL
jgi:hypothetical protein